MAAGRGGGEGRDIIIFKERTRSEGKSGHFPDRVGSTEKKRAATCTDKKEKQIFLKVKEIENGLSADGCLYTSSYMGKCLRISSCIRKPFLIYDFATAPL
jgi:hypothetical protein